MQTRRSRFGPTLLIWTLLTLPFWVGCDGCRLPGQASNQPPAPPPEVSSEFNFGGPQALPLGNASGQTGVKPGHWFTASETMRANQADHRGLLRQRIELPRQTNQVDGFDLSTPDANAAGEKILVPLLSERPAVLPQMRTKRFDARLLAGLPRSINRDTKATLSGQFVSATQAKFPDVSERAVPMLQPQEYFFIVLTKRPERFSSLQTADWIRPPVDEGESELGIETPSNYRLVLPKADGLLTLPETIFDWTSTAVLLWDDLDPSTLTVQQTRAVIDWVHFGGRLIINGTGAGIELTRSKLGPLMPMEVQGNGELDAASVAQLLENWSVPGDTTTQQQVAIARERSARLQVDGQVHPDAVSVRDTSELMLKRQVGSGQVILSRFDLTSDWLLGWRSRDSFFNAAVLGRPPRRYVTMDDVVQQRFADDQAIRIADASTNTGLRFMARDGRLVKASAVAESVDAVDKPSAQRRGEPTTSEVTAEEPAKKPGTFQGTEFVPHPIAGMGSWRDDSDAAILTMATLRSQSGIVIPPRPFVIKALAIYLAVLVPLNYLFFRVLGRLEWAWLAVPLIGLGGAGWIARGASLDVGFARSRTEIAIVEMQPEYSRAHATRFISLYNSLSRRYDFAFDTPDAAAAPIGVLGQMKIGEEEREPVTLRYGFADGPTLSGVSVASNRTRIFHTEQIIDMGGSVQLRDNSVRNNTQFELLDCWAIARDKEDNFKVANLGTCAAGATIRVRWTQSETVRLPDDLPLDLQQLMSSMLRGETLPPDATRLVARCETPLPGLTISPEPAQQTFGAVVIVHLTRPAIDVPRGDANLMPDRLEKQRQNRLDDGVVGDADAEVKVNASF